jgi:hypothetical protein
MCFLRWCERLLDADVELSPSGQSEPGAAARAKWLRLFDLFQAEQVAEEAAGLRLTAAWRRDLDVV